MHATVLGMAIAFAPPVPLMSSRRSAIPHTRAKATKCIVARSNSPEPLEECDHIVTDALLAMHGHAALMRALATPAVKLATEVASMGMAAFSVLFPEPRNGPKPRKKADELADPDSIFISTTPHRVRLHVKVVRPRHIAPYNFTPPTTYDVLCLHGAMGSTHCFRHMLSNLGSLFGGSVAAFDRPPFGLSETATYLSLPLGLQEEAALTHSAARALRMRLNKLVLIGHSLGGAVALRAALDAPTPPAGLVLLAPALSVQMPRAVRAAVRATLAVPPVGRRVVRERCRAMANSARRRKRFYDDEAGHEGYVRPMQRAHWDEALRKYVREFAAVGFSLWDHEEELRALRIPTLVIAADADRLIGSRGLERLVDTMPNATLVQMNNASHMMFEDAPDKVVRIIEAWMHQVGLVPDHGQHP